MRRSGKGLGVKKSHFANYALLEWACKHVHALSRPVILFSKEKTERPTCFFFAFFFFGFLIFFFGGGRGELLTAPSMES